MNEALKKRFVDSFGYEPEREFVSPGRLEIIGNHTDHNHGFAIVASASLYIRCVARKRSDNVINLNSEGNKFYNIKAGEAKPNEKEYSTTYALIKGVVNGLIKRGYHVGGFDAYCVSEVPSGGGVSSSAAFECLIGAIESALYNDNKVSKMDLAKVSQEAERDFFGKPCGILDQIGCAYGGISVVDFFDDKNPIVSNTNFPFGLKIVLTNPGGSHAGLTDYYASIPNDMKHVAKLLGREYLREASLKDVQHFNRTHLGVLTKQEYKRAVHFYKECDRVKEAYKALLANDEAEFIKIINESGLSSSHTLKNTSVPNRYHNSPERALNIARKVAPHSAHRVHGGGFMGTIISFIREEEYPTFKEAMQKAFGEKAVIDVSISPFGSVAL